MWFTRLVRAVLYSTADTVPDNVCALLIRKQNFKEYVQRWDHDYFFFFFSFADHHKILFTGLHHVTKIIEKSPENFSRI